MQRVMTGMTILVPTAERETEGDRLAPRVAGLEHQTLVFLDNVGAGIGGGHKGTSPFFGRVREKLEERFTFANVRWVVKPNRCRRATREMLEEIRRTAGVGINGICA